MKKVFLFIFILSALFLIFLFQINSCSATVTINLYPIEDAYGNDSSSNSWSLLKFSLSHIPPTAIIKKAQLGLYGAEVWAPNQPLNIRVSGCTNISWIDESLDDNNLGCNIQMSNRSEFAGINQWTYWNVSNLVNSTYLSGTPPDKNLTILLNTTVPVMSARSNGATLATGYFGSPTTAYWASFYSSTAGSDVPFLSVTYEGPDPIYNNSIMLGFIPPTDANDTTILRNSTYINVSVQSGDYPINTFGIEWNKTNISIFDSSLSLLMNLNGNAEDKSKYNNDGTLYGNTNCNVQGRYNLACSFDGSGDYISIPDSPSLSPRNKLTVSQWIYPRAAGSSGADLATIWKGDISSTTSQSYGFIWTAVPEIAFSIGSSSNFYRVRAPIPLNRWSHVAGTYDGSTMKLYVNGNLVDSAPVSISIVDTDTPLIIGASYYFSAFKYFNGSIDEVRIYNRTLSAQEINFSYHTEIGRYFMNISDQPDGLYSYYGWANDSFGNFNTTKKNVLNFNYFFCSDGTDYDHCSLTLPLFCSNGVLVNNCTICGCPSGQACNGTTRSCYTFNTTCSDSTLNHQCSATKPLYCNNATLITNCSSCGCPSGQSCNSTSEICYASPLSPCILTSASISGNCAGGTSTDCEQGETISLSGTYTGNCSLANFMQIDARNTSSSCVLEYVGQDMEGIFSSITPSSGTISGTWTIPSIPTVCQGKVINAIWSSLWNGNPSSGTWINTTGVAAAGDFTFYTPAAPTCSDGTLYNQCSTTLPLYCDSGSLISNCTSCSCPSGQSCNSTDQSCFITPAAQYSRLLISGRIIYYGSVNRCQNCTVIMSFLDAVNTSVTNSSGNFDIVLEPSTKFNSGSYVINGTITIPTGRRFNFKRTINVV